MLSLTFENSCLERKAYLNNSVSLSVCPSLAMFDLNIIRSVFMHSREKLRSVRDFSNEYKGGT